MNQQTLSNKSVRFFPNWDEDNIYQMAGLIAMVDFIFSNNPHAERWIEIGCYIGESSSIFLSFAKLKRLDCVDHWNLSIQALNRRLHREIAKSRCFVHHAESCDFAKEVPDGSVDVVYIDGDHSYECVTKDIFAYHPKLKTNGYLCGHDYSVAWPGVMSAVDEFAMATKKGLKVFEDSSWVLTTETYDPPSNI